MYLCKYINQLSSLWKKQQNIVHASISTSNAEIELKHFFRDEEIFDYPGVSFGSIYGDVEAKQASWRNRKKGRSSSRRTALKELFMHN